MARTRPVVSSCLMALLLILAVEPGPVAAAPDPLLSLIPRDGEVEGFVRDGAPILCYDEESLAEHIDGAAPFYLERGAVAVLFQYYLRKASGEDLKIEIYRMKDRTSARHLFEEIERGRPASESSSTR